LVRLVDYWLGWLIILFIRNEDKYNYISVDMGSEWRYE